MSPTERDLRASLQQGEGEPIDVDRIVAVGAAARSQRRTRLASVAAAVVLVVAAGTATGVVLARDGGNGTTSADGGDAARADSPERAAGAAPGDPAPASSASPGDTAPASRTPVPAVCPVSFSQRSLPGGAQSGALFDRPAASITVCGYGSPLQTPNPASFTVSGSLAGELQGSLEDASSSPTGTPCGAIRSNDKRNLAFLAVDAAGRAMRVITTTLSVPICDTRTTNGVVVRYGWVPPLGLRQQLYALTPSGSPSALPSRVPSGKNIGSPVR